MTKPLDYHPDPKLDLLLERVIDVPRQLVWEAWTRPQHVKQWFTPGALANRRVRDRPPPRRDVSHRDALARGAGVPNVGCYLEVIEGERLVWTDALEPGFCPARHALDKETHGIGAFTAVITLTSQGQATRYSALAMDSSEEDRKKHEAMGFHDGWGKALDQLVALAKTLRS